jgi:DNA-binding transcriptional regulator YiaG
MTPAQCRAARELLNMSEAKLAVAADVPIWTVAAFEEGTLLVTPHAHIAAIQRALEAAGIVFAAGNGNAGVTLKGDG